MSDHKEPENNPSLSSDLDRDEFLIDEDSGISSEEQHEILSQIEKVANENKISVSPSTFSIKALKKGILFPILVNIIALLALAGGLFAIFYFMQLEETRIVVGGTAIESAEGKLLAELKREADAKLAEKEAEIASIQSRLEEISRERADLLASMEERIQTKEEELRRELEAELEAEKQRLVEQGLSDAELDTRLKEFEALKTAELNEKLEAFRQEAEAEMAQMESDLEELQAEYRQELEEANSEKERILEEAREREAELRRRLEEEAARREEELSRTSEELSETESQLSEAQSELARLSRMKEREELINDRIIGFYGNIEEAFDSGNLDSAKQSLASLREYLNDPTIVVLEPFRERRETELFVIESLLSFIEDRAEQEAEQIDTTELIAAAGILREIRELVVQADRYMDGGNEEEGERLYTEALTKLPEIQKSHRYFMEKVDPAEIERQLNFSKEVASARRAFEQGEYLESLSLYTRALEFLPDDTPGKANVVSDIRKAGIELAKYEYVPQSYLEAEKSYDDARQLAEAGQYEEAVAEYLEILDKYPDTELLPQITKGIGISVRQAVLAGEKEGAEGAIAEIEAAGPPSSAEAALLIQKGERLHVDGEYQEAISTYMEVLEEYPRTRQSIDVSQKIGQSLDAMLVSYSLDMENLESSNKRYAERIAALEEQIKAREEGADITESELANLKLEKDGYQGELEEAEEKIDQLEERLERAQEAESAAAREEVGRLEGIITELESKIAELERQIAEGEAETAELRTKAEEEIARLSTFEEIYRTLQSQYRDYAEVEDQILRSEEASSLLESKLELDRFLASEVVEETFPGILDRVKRYDQAFEKAGREVVAQELIDIVYDLSFFDSPSDRESFLEEEKERYIDEPVMLDVIDELMELVQS